MSVLAVHPGALGDVILFGGSDYAMRIWIRPDRLAKLGLTVTDLQNAIKQQNTLSPAGQIGGEPSPEGTQFTYTVKTQGRLLNAEEFGAVMEGAGLRVLDVVPFAFGAANLYVAEPARAEGV